VSNGVTLSQLDQSLAEHGLCVRGAFEVSAEDPMPAPGLGVTPAALVIVGHAGSALWAAFSASSEFCDGHPDPLDRWSRRIGEALALRFHAHALFPFDGPPYHPFQRWATRAEALRASPLGILIHPQFGLWHAYRFALALPLVPSDLRPTPIADSPCLTCSASPCVSACPVGAISLSGYRAQPCIEHLRNVPDSSCNATGCLSRQACPVGETYRYQPAHRQFHMRAFLSGMSG